MRERYPTFVDALRDMDDALCMTHLFAQMQAVGTIQAKRTQMCQVRPSRIPPTHG